MHKAIEIYILNIPINYYLNKQVEHCFMHTPVLINPAGHIISDHQFNCVSEW